MDLTSDQHKITADHLGRLAFVYVRQSSLKQVQRNVGSTARQYDLSLRAQELGWQAAQLVVIDQDQARSGASSVARSGFQHLVAEVGLGHAGAVLSLEASRLARASSDWYRLLEICALTQTLVIDEEGIYDPGQYNDRLLLGFKGTMSEAELHWIRSRLSGGKLELARQGKLRIHPPTGFVHEASGKLIKDPDEAIQSSIQAVFESFRRCGTARGVMLEFRARQLLIPCRLWGTLHAGECVWKPLSAHRVLDILHNPCYAGTYVYGQTQTLPHTSDSGQPRVRQVKRQTWPIVIQEHHEAYLSWAEFQQNQQRLEDNRNGRERSRRGAIREGVGLLQGIVLCGRCGRRMKVRYQEIRTRPTYVCDGHYQSVGDQWCQAIRGQHIDEAIAQVVLQAMQPAQAIVALKALDALQAQSQAIERQQKLQLERAQYEADVARRRFLHVEPENRLVARSLERDWNEKLNLVDTLQRAQASQPRLALQSVDDFEKERLLQLVQDFPTLWAAASTSHAERKQIVRYLIKDVTLLGLERTIQVGIRWQSGATTEVRLSRGTLRTSNEIIDRIRELAQRYQSDEQIAATLNALGWTTARRHPFTASRVKELRVNYHIARGDNRCPAHYPLGQRADGCYSVRKTSELLNWSISTIHKWCKRGILEAHQDAPQSPIWVRLDAQKIAELRHPNNPWDSSLL